MQQRSLFPETMSWLLKIEIRHFYEQIHQDLFSFNITAQKETCIYSLINITAWPWRTGMFPSAWWYGWYVQSRRKKVVPPLIWVTRPWFWRVTLLLSLSNAFCLCKTGAIYLIYAGENADTSAANIFQTLKLTTKQSRLIKKLYSQEENMHFHFAVNCPFMLCTCSHHCKK